MNVTGLTVHIGARVGAAVAEPTRDSSQWSTYGSVVIAQAGARGIRGRRQAQQTQCDLFSEEDV